MSISLRGSHEEISIFVPVESTAEKALDTMIEKMEVIRKKYMKQLYSEFNQYFVQLANISDSNSGKSNSNQS
jgi:hypothetical protein